MIYALIAIAAPLVGGLLGLLLGIALERIDW